MALESLLVEICHLPGTMTGLLITTCGEIVPIFQRKSTEGGPSLTGQCLSIGAIGIEEGRVFLMIGKDWRGDLYLHFHHLLLLAVAVGDVTLGREVDRQCGVAPHLKSTVGMCSWDGVEMIGEAWLETALGVHINMVRAC